mmetsp:Transcript_26696/g.71704  ORF Transcript_26696/g.71704 Transcript_26696/m.71704 type:complete len:224 (+) Transcript_26696:296-967(+)
MRLPRAHVPARSPLGQCRRLRRRAGGADAAAHAAAHGRLAAPRERPADPLPPGQHPRGGAGRVLLARAADLRPNGPAATAHPARNPRPSPQGHGGAAALHHHARARQGRHDRRRVHGRLARAPLPAGGRRRRGGGARHGNRLVRADCAAAAAGGEETLVQERRGPGDRHPPPTLQAHPAGADGGRRPGMAGPLGRGAELWHPLRGVRRPLERGADRYGADPHV